MLEFVFVHAGIGSEGCVAHGHELGEEENEDGHEADAFDPVILRDGARETVVGESIVCRGEEMDECRCDDDARTKVFSYEEGPAGDANALMTGRVDGKGGT